MIITLRNVQSAFPALDTPKPFGDGPARYGITALLKNGDPQIQMVQDAIKQVATDKWGAKADAILKSLEADKKVCLRSGESKSQYAGFEDSMFVAASNAVKPLLVDADKTELPEASGKIYSGCYVNVSIDIWPQNNKFGKRINAKLRAVQFVRDGDAFSGSAPATVDEFDDLSTGDANDLS